MPPWAIRSIGLAAVDAAHVVAVLQPAADLDHRRVGAAVGAAGAVGRRARRHGERASGQRPAALLGCPRALGGVGGETLGAGQHQPRQSRQRDLGVHPGGLREPACTAREGLAPDGLAAALEGPADLVLQVARALLHHDDLIDLVGQPANSRGVDRPGQARAQHRRRAVEAQLGEGVAQQRVGGAGDDEPEAPCARARPARLVAVDARREDRGLQQRQAPLEEVGLEGGGEGGQRDGVRGADGRRVQGDPVARPDGGLAVGGQVHHPGPVGLDGGHDHAHEQTAAGGQIEGQAHQVLHLLGARRLEDGDARAREREAAVRAHLGGGEGGVVTHHHDAGGPRRGAGGVGDRQPVEGDVGADALEDGHGARARHLARPVHHRRALGLVVGQRGLDAQLAEVVGVVLADREHVRDRGARVPGQQGGPRLQRALDDELVAVQHRPAGAPSQRRALRGPGLPIDREGRHGQLLGSS